VLACGAALTEVCTTTAASRMWGINVLSFRNWVRPEGSAGTAAAEPADRKEKTTADAVAVDRYGGILRAGGSEAAER
jgi:hypothetical protein